VTASDGETFLEYFQDNEKSIPTTLTTSRKLSTGVDAPEVKHIILMRPIQSMIEFKQIIGRGTRLYDNKDYFTIHDFVNAVALFNDPEWNGESLEPLEPINKRTEPVDKLTIDINNNDKDDEHTQTVKKPVIIQLSSNRINNLNHVTETFLSDKNGNLISVTDYLQQFYNQMPVVCYDEKALSALWIVPQERQELINQFSENGYDLKHIQLIIDMNDSDLYDVLMNIAYAKPIISRKDRADKALMILKNKNYTIELTEFLTFTLEQYILVGTEAIDIDNLPRLLELKYQTLTDAKLKLGDIAMIRQNFMELQKFLYLNL
jgi:type I restriction enzyme, R subunit